MNRAELIASDDPLHKLAMERHALSQAKCHEWSGEINRRYNELLRWFEAKNRLHPHLVLSKLYKFLDWTIEVSHIEKNSVCSSGCSHCCYVPVEILEIEADYIAAKIGKKRVSDASLLVEGDHRKTPCPFLKNNLCSIYKYRPFSCRTFFTYDSPDECAKGGEQSHIIMTAETNPVSVQMIGLLLHNGLRARGDIREWFPD